MTSTIVMPMIGNIFRQGTCGGTEKRSIGHGGI